MPTKDNTERKKFVQATFKNRQFAADKLRMYAAMFEGARTHDDIETVLTELLFLSNRTIKRDKQKKNVVTSFYCEKNNITLHI